MTMIPKKIEEIVGEFAQLCANGFLARWDLLPVELYASEAYEVVGGLISRQATLAIELALTPPMWSGHIAPLILRGMTDAHITLAWILGDFEVRAKEYISYSIGQEKLAYEHLEVEYESNKDDAIAKMIEMKKGWVNSQRKDWFVEVNVGSWSGTSTRKMAKESGCERLYKFAFVPFSAVSHNMWSHISLYNMETCSNPLHKFHRVPTIQDAVLDVDYVYRASKYISCSFEVVDKHFELDLELELPVDFMERKLSEHDNTEDDEYEVRK